MSNFTIIGEIGEILVDMLKSNFLATSEFAQPITEIALGAPDDEESTLHTVKPRVIVFLYHLEKNAHFENPDDCYHKLALELYYLVIAAAKEKAIEHKIIGKVAEVFNQNKVLKAADYPGKPGFTAAKADIKINIASMTIDDKHKLWTAFPKIAEKTFLPYIIRPVTIISEPPSPGSIVISRDYTISPLSQKGKEK